MVEQTYTAAQPETFMIEKLYIEIAVDLRLVRLATSPPLCQRKDLCRPGRSQPPQFPYRDGLGTSEALPFGDTASGDLHMIANPEIAHHLL